MPHSFDLENDLMNPTNENTIGECFDKTIPVENGDSVLFTTTFDDSVFTGKYVKEFNCVIKPDGTKIDRELIDYWYHIPFNIIQEKLNTDAFNESYNELVIKNSETYKKNEIEEYIETMVDPNIEELDDDKEFLVNLFTRNVRNEKIDFTNYKFMMEVLFEEQFGLIVYSPKVDVSNLKNICFNMYSIMKMIKKETYDSICETLNRFTNGE